MKVVIFIDVQNDFIDGVLGVDIDKTVTDKIRKYAYICKCEHVPMLATCDTHEEDYLKTLEGQKLPVEHCIKCTDGWQLDEGLDVYIPLDNRIEKRTFGSINNLSQKLGELDDSLKHIYGIGITEIELCGFCASICVISNALILRATYPNLKISILKNLCADTTPENYAAALAVARCNQIDVISADVAD